MRTITPSGAEDVKYLLTRLHQMVQTPCMARDKPPYYTEALKEFISCMSQSEVNEFALTCGTTGGHLRNCANGSRGVSGKLAAQIEAVTRKQLTRKELRSDWEEIWPELAATKKGKK